MLALNQLATATASLLALAAVLTNCGNAPQLTPAASGPNFSETSDQAQAVFDPGGLGSLEVRSPEGDPGLLTLKSVRISAQQSGDMAEVAATHTFANDSDAVMEGTFRFPMPQGSLLTGLAMMINGQLMEGELVERKKAREVYETIVDSMQDPALLEWESGSTFKIRVFPIEAHSDKVVVMRYLTPLRRSGSQLEFVQAARSEAGGSAVTRLEVEWNGRQVFAANNVENGSLIAAAAQPVSAVLKQEQADGNYALVRLDGDWSKIPTTSHSPAKNWFIIVDTSRSALEEFPKVLEALPVLIESLPKGARFQVVTSDLDATSSSEGLQDVTPESIAAALGSLKQTTPDGASDMGRAFQVVAALAEGVSERAVIYLGDCEPTWGQTHALELQTLLSGSLPKTPLYPVILGTSVNNELAEQLAASTGGRTAHLRRAEDLTRFAPTLATGVPTLRGIQVTTGAGAVVLPSGPITLEKGRETVLLVKAPPGQDPLSGLKIGVTQHGQTLDLLPQTPAQQSGSVARRFGAAQVRQLEQEGAAPESIVKTSLDYGVVSKLTSFLVLESEEAYARFAIARKPAAQATNAARVTGANLETADGTSISADRIQPGDPEIFIDAERDAVSVTVTFPFGETKTAEYDVGARGGRGAWLVRFLVPLETAEGEYDALAHITRRDGSIELRKVSYTVDNAAPELNITLKPAKRQRNMTEVLVYADGDPALSDLKRVELRTPVGTVHQLVAIRWGTFRAFIPDAELRAGTLRVVGFDAALNHRVKELQLP